MTSEILSAWSTDCNNLYDLSFNVGEERDAALFRERSMILRSQSPFFPSALSSLRCAQGVNPQNTPILAKTVFEYFPPAIFESILNYTYHGKITLEHRKITEIFELLLASGELCLQDLSELIQTYLIQENDDWLHSSFVLAFRTAHQDDSFKKLQLHCNGIFENKPEIVVRSQDFVHMQKRLLVRFLKQKNPTVEQVEIWQRLVSWGIAHRPGLPSDNSVWTSTQWSDLKKAIRDLVPLVRFWEIPANDFYEKVIPFEKALPRAIFHDMLRHYLVPQPPPQYSASVPPPPYPSFDTQLLTPSHIGCISNWISWSKRSPMESKQGFQFNLLLRGSRDGFSPLQFHKLCDLKGPTVVVIKVRETGQLIGGYNPSTWLSEFKFFSTSYHETNESFIFSLGTEENPKPIYSRVKDSSKAIGQYSHLGPDFGESDLSLQGFDYHEEKLCFCQQDSYEVGILSDDNERTYFSVDDYEVFEVVNTKNL